MNLRDRVEQLELRTPMPMTVNEVCKWFAMNADERAIGRDGETPGDLDGIWIANGRHTPEEWEWYDRNAENFRISLQSIQRRLGS